MGLSQREIAAAIGRSQPEVSRLLRFRGNSALGRKLKINRDAVLKIAATHGATDIKVFGSVARGTDTARSDIDLLATIKSGTGLFALARLENELSDFLGVDVDVVPANNLRKNLEDQVLSEAIAL